MNTQEINKILKKKIPCFIGTFPKDAIPRVRVRPAMMVVNTHPASKRGEHWTAIYVINKDEAEFFDSFGFPALEPEIRRYLSNNCATWRYSPRTLQHPLATTCGLFCCLFLYARSKGMSYLKFRRLFTRDLEVNESRIIRYARLLRLK